MQATRKNSMYNHWRNAAPHKKVTIKWKKTTHFANPARLNKTTVCRSKLELQEKQLLPKPKLLSDSSGWLCAAITFVGICNWSFHYHANQSQHRQLDTFQGSRKSRPVKGKKFSCCERKQIFCELLFCGNSLCGTDGTRFQNFSNWHLTVILLISYCHITCNTKL